MNFKYAFVMSISLIVLAAAIFPPCLGATLKEYHSTPQINTKTEDITFHWEKSLLRGNWDRTRLWDWGLLGHCYISFSYSLDTSMDIPATLSMNYPSFLEPNQTFLIETKLETTGDRIIEIRPAIYFGIDLAIPLVKSFQATYGGQWNMTFDLNTKDMQQTLSKVWVGDFNNGQLLSIAKTAMNLNQYVTLQRVDLSNGGLGTLVLGQIRVDLFRAVLNALKQLVIPPPLDKLVDLLDWLVSKFFRFSTGLIITPTISAYVSCPFQTDSSVARLGTNFIQFDSDLSPKTIQLSISSDGEEKNGANEFRIQSSPISFSYLFDVDWQYYFDIDIGLLGQQLYQHTWTFDIYRGPSINWDSQPVQNSLEIVSKIDEPLRANDPSVDSGNVTIDLADKSGISEATLWYSTDNQNWSSMPLSLEGGTSYSVKPISDVSKDTNVSYFIKVVDGEGSSYSIGSNDAYFMYALKPPQSPFLIVLQSPQNLWILAVAVVLILVVTASLVLRRQKRKSSQRGISPTIPPAPGNAQTTFCVYQKH